ncbi:PAS domain S-box protein [Spirulina sp. CS-785/01]|uniref:PAS domain S-box protein n=1 Tax=Spirulina sp. CS-785/01 TaxID=3021716 RepID=UPI002330C030|nr:PAS domain S-box protein [Spirulina sp. CS-785/01]MDB9315734.1 PAS domain S-box protein [Spirulina sp. CS-785/01]
MNIQSESLQKNILVVDDTPANLRLLTELLSQRGHDVRPAINGQIALAAIHNKLPDLILLDIMMPEINGYEMCKQLKANPVTQHIPIIFISALDNPEDKIEAFQAGGVDYIPKPFHKTEVLMRVENQLRLLQAQESLRESEARFRAIFEKAAMGICVTRPDGNIIETNQAFQHFLGYNNQQLQGKSLLEFSHPEDRERDRSQFADLCGGNKETYQLEKRYLRANGQVVWGRLTTCAVKQKQTLQFAFSFVEDITERKHAQEALKASEQEMRAIFQAMTDFVSIRDRQGKCLKIAPTKSLQDQATQQHYLGKTLQETYTPPTAEQFTQAITQTLDQHEPTDIEYQITLNNQPTWFDGRVSPFSEDTVVIVARDISQRKLIEQKLRTNEAEIRGIFEAMTDIVLVIDPNNHNIQVMPTNYLQRYHAENGISPNQVIDATFQQLVGAESNPEFWSPIEEAIDQQTNINFEYNLALENQQIWFAASISPLPNQTVIWVARDISDRVRAEQGLQKLADELEKRVAQRTTLLREANQKLRREIYERVQAEQGLAASEERFRQAVDNIPDVVVIYSPDLRYQFANAQALWLTHNTLDNMKGKTDTELFPPEMTDRYLFLLHRAQETGQLQTQECVLPIPNQENRTFIFTYVPLFNPNGAIYQILGLAYDITERKRSEEAVRVAKERLEAVLDAVPGFISWIRQTPDLEYLGVNHQLAAAFNRRPEEFVGQPLGFMALGDEFQHTVEDFFQDDSPVITKVVEIGAHEESRHYLIVAQKYQQNTAAVVVGIDITARIQAEDKLRYASQRSQLLSELTVKIRQSLDLEEILSTAVVEVQKTLEADRVAIVQYQENHQGRVVQEAVLEDFSSLQGKVLALPEKLSQKTPVDYCITDAQIETCPGGEAVQSCLLVPILIQEEFWGALVVHQCRSHREWRTDEIELLTSLTNQVGIALSQAQLLNHLEEMVAERTNELQATNEDLEQEIQERSKAELALRDSEEQLRRVIQNNAYGIVVCNQVGEIYFLNEAATRIFGRSEEQLLGQQLGIPFYGRGQHGATTEISELSLLRPDGTQCVVEMRSVSINWEGNPHALLISLVDITERKAVEQMKDEFLSVASHELRTPLTSIRGSLGLLATGQLGNLHEKGQQMLKIAVNNTDRLTRLLNDILDLERIKSGRVQIVHQHCDAVELLIQAAQAMQAMADQAQVKLCLQVNAAQKLFTEIDVTNVASLAAPLPLWADPDQILQTLTNLISNAVKFSPVQGEVSIGVTEEENRILFRVTDHGRGIPADKLETIFARFQQVDASDSREKGGTGLGLPICREIIRKHQGEIWVESSFGEGSTFYFTLPLPPKQG